MFDPCITHHFSLHATETDDQTTHARPAAKSLCPWPACRKSTPTRRLHSWPGRAPRHATRGVRTCNPAGAHRDLRECPAEQLRVRLGTYSSEPPLAPLRKAFRAAWNCAKSGPSSSSVSGTTTSTGSGKQFPHSQNDAFERCHRMEGVNEAQVHWGPGLQVRRQVRYLVTVSIKARCSSTAANTIGLMSSWGVPST